MRPRLDVRRFPRASPGSAWDAQFPETWATFEQVQAMRNRVAATWKCPRGVPSHLAPFYKQCKTEVEFARLNPEAYFALRAALLNEPRQWVFEEITGPGKRDIVQQAGDVVDALLAFVYRADGHLNHARAPGASVWDALFVFSDDLNANSGVGGVGSGSRAVPIPAPPQAPAPAPAPAPASAPLVKRQPQGRVGARTTQPGAQRTRPVRHPHVPNGGPRSPASALSVLSAPGQEQGQAHVPLPVPLPVPQQPPALLAPAPAPAPAPARQMPEPQPQHETRPLRESPAEPSPPHEELTAEEPTAEEPTAEPSSALSTPPTAPSAPSTSLPKKAKPKEPRVRAKANAKAAKAKADAGAAVDDDIVRAACLSHALDEEAAAATASAPAAAPAAAAAAAKSSSDAGRSAAAKARVLQQHAHQDWADESADLRDELTTGSETFAHVAAAFTTAVCAQVVAHCLLVEALPDDLRPPARVPECVRFGYGDNASGSPDSSTSTQLEFCPPRALSDRWEIEMHGLTTLAGVATRLPDHLVRGELLQMVHLISATAELTKGAWNMQRVLHELSLYLCGGGTKSSRVPDKMRVLAEHARRTQCLLAALVFEAQSFFQTLRAAASEELRVEIVRLDVGDATSARFRDCSTHALNALSRSLRVPSASEALGAFATADFLVQFQLGAISSAVEIASRRGEADEHAAGGGSGGSGGSGAAGAGAGAAMTPMVEAAACLWAVGHAAARLRAAAHTMTHLGPSHAAMSTRAAAALAHHKNETSEGRHEKVKEGQGQGQGLLFPAFVVRCNAVTASFLAIAFRSALPDDPDAAAAAAAAAAAPVAAAPEPEHRVFWRQLTNQDADFYAWVIASHHVPDFMAASAFLRAVSVPAYLETPVSPALAAVSLLPSAASAKAAAKKAPAPEPASEPAPEATRAATLGSKAAAAARAAAEAAREAAKEAEADRRRNAMSEDEVTCIMRVLDDAACVETYVAPDGTTTATGGVMHTRVATAAEQHACNVALDAVLTTVLLARKNNFSLEEGHTLVHQVARLLATMRTDVPSRNQTFVFPLADRSQYLIPGRHLLQRQAACATRFRQSNLCGGKA